MNILGRSGVFLLLVIIVNIHESCANDNHGSENSTTKFRIESNSQFPFTILGTRISTITFNYTFVDSEVILTGRKWVVSATLDNSKLAEIIGGEKEMKIMNCTGAFDIQILGKLPGRVTLYIKVSPLDDELHSIPTGHQRFIQLNNSNARIFSNQNSSGDITFVFKIYVEREERPIDIAFNAVIVLLVVCVNVGMGCKVDLEVVKSELKKPVSPIIGLCSQFLVMPVIAFAIAYNMDLDPGQALGLFALGCSPGGSASNAYTHFLKGNISLSVTMTLISTIAALGFMPLWLLSLGKLIYSDRDVKIPFENIMFSLVGMVVPVMVGLFLQKKFPKIAKLCIKAIKYFVIIFVIFMLTVGVYANIYIFYLISSKVLLVSAMLPYLGFIFGGVIALVMRQTIPNIIAIAVETGIQNTGIPIIVLRLSLLGPDKDTSIVPPVISALFTPIPLIFAILFVQGRRYWHKRKERKENEEKVRMNEREDSTERFLTTCENT